MRFHRAGAARPAAVILLATISTATPLMAATPFVFETVDAAGRTGLTSSLALDAQGDPHIAYYDLSNHDLRYAKRTGTAWALETIDASGITGVTPSLALDPFGDAHVAYYDSTGLDLKYAKRTRGGSWTIETVASAGNVGLAPSLALDAAGIPRISYYDVTNGDLRYASKATGSWVTELVDPAGDVGRFSSLALDPFGVPKIAYLDITGSRIRFADKGTGTWTSLIVDNTSLVSGPFPLSLALDGQGRPRIAYTGWSGSFAYLGFAHLDQGIVWTIEQAAGFGVGVFPSMAVDADGMERIAYTNESGMLSLAIHAGGSWIQEPLSKRCINPSLRLDPQGNARISFLDPEGDDLKLADAAIHVTSPNGGERWASGSTQTVRWTGSGLVDVQISTDGGFTYAPVAYAVSGGSALITVPALASEQARVRVMRFNPLSTSESRGTFTIGPDVVPPWWARTVDATGNVGGFTSLELDAHGSPRLAYWDGTNADLRYAARLGGVWTTELVDATNNTGQWASLELDAQGSPCIAYIDATLANLKFARKTNGMWGIETAGSGASSDASISLSLDGSGNPHVSLADATLDLRYVRKSGGMWSSEIVDPNVEVSFTSLALDGQGNPHIAYSDDLTSSLRYARKSAGVWTIESVGAPGIAWYPSIALDNTGNATVAFYDLSAGDLRLARRIDGRWHLETIDAAGNVGAYASLALDGENDPHVGYLDQTNGDLKAATRVGGTWWIETVDAGGSVGFSASLALDAQGVARVGYYDQTNGDLRYASAAVEILEPAPGASWPVGARRAVRWEGTGTADLYLSVDGGATWSLREVGLTGGEYRFTVPHLPSKFCKVRVSRAIPGSYAESDSFFTIQTSVSLLALLAAPAPGGAQGAVLSWSTDPGPADLAGYRLERSAAGAWAPWMPLTRETTIADPAAGPGTRYRLYAVNGLGEEVLVGETSFALRAPLSAWPLPYRGGPLHVSFAAAAGLGGSAATTEVSLFDVHGRLVRTIASGRRDAGYHETAWDGRDERGAKVAAGVYLLRLRSEGQERTLKVAVLR